jgi:hypothetical protein
MRVGIAALVTLTRDSLAMTTVPNVACTLRARVPRTSG